jgi:tetratricopeptide (TPR) repeat protein
LYINSLLQFGAFYLKENENEIALKYFDKIDSLYNIYQNENFINNQFYIYSLIKFGSYYQINNENEKALKYYEKIDSLYDLYQNKDYLNYYLEANFHIALLVLIELNNFEESLKKSIFLKDFLEINNLTIAYKEIYIKCFYKISNCYFDLQKFNEALIYAKENEKLVKNEYGEKSEDYLISLRLLTWIYTMPDINKLDEAYKIYTTLKKLNKEIYGIESEQYLYANKELACFYLFNKGDILELMKFFATHQKEFKESEKLLFENKEISTRLYGKQSIENVKLNNLLSSLYFAGKNQLAYFNVLMENKIILSKMQNIEYDIIIQNNSSLASVFEINEEYNEASTYFIRK